MVMLGEVDPAKEAGSLTKVTADVSFGCVVGLDSFVVGRRRAFVDRLLVSSRIHLHTHPHHKTGNHRDVAGVRGGGEGGVGLRVMKPRGDFGSSRAEKNREGARHTYPRGRPRVGEGNAETGGEGVQRFAYEGRKINPKQQKQRKMRLLRLPLVSLASMFYFLLRTPQSHTVGRLSLHDD